MDYIIEDKSNLGLDMRATGERIGGLIKDAGMTERTIAEQMHLSVQAINKWKHGKSLPDIENLFMLGQLLSTSVDDMLVPRFNVNKSVMEMRRCDSYRRIQDSRIRNYFVSLYQKNNQPQVE